MIWNVNMDKTFKIEHDFSKFQNIFLAQNKILNLISKKDEQFLFEKHIYDSLAIKLTDCIANGKKLLDIGCGGGFPCVPIAIEYPELDVVGIDSIQKKINAVNTIKEELKINNLSLICGRAENYNDKKFDIITSRAVADLSVIVKYALPLLKDNGVFVAYKSKKVYKELENAKTVITKYNAELLDIIKYTLPLEEVYERNLVLIGRKS